MLFRSQNPTVYQINTPQSYLYYEVYDHFVRQFPNANVIFIEASQGTKDKAEFIKGLKDELRNRSIPDSRTDGYGFRVVRAPIRLIGEVS